MHTRHPLADMFLRTKIQLPQREKDSLETREPSHSLQIGCLLLFSKEFSRFTRRHLPLIPMDVNVAMGIHGNLKDQLSLQSAMSAMHECGHGPSNLPLKLL